jgi:hypothetical protein
MTPNDFRKLALDLPEVVEAQPMSHPDFRVRGKIFATLAYPDKNLAGSSSHCRINSSSHGRMRVRSLLFRILGRAWVDARPPEGRKERDRAAGPAGRLASRRAKRPVQRVAQDR